MWDYYKARVHPMYPASSLAFMKRERGIIFCAHPDPPGQQDAQGSRIMPPPDGFILYVAAGVYSDLLLWYGLGTSQVDAPSWFGPTVQYVAGIDAIPGLARQFDERMVDCRDSNSILTLDQLNEATFVIAFRYPSDGTQRIGRTPGSTDSDAAVQMCHFMAFIIRKSDKGQFWKLLNLLADGGKFDASVKAAYGRTTAQLYDAWLSDVKRLTVTDKRAPERK